MKKGLTKEEAIRRHRMMWEWIANETLRRKECADSFDAFQHFGWEIRQCQNMDWCCEYANKVDIDGSCDHCPIVWPSKANWIQCINYANTTSSDGKGILMTWVSALAKNDWRTAAYYALYISMLPEKK